MALAQPWEHLVDPLNTPWLFSRIFTLLRHHEVFPNWERGKDATSLRYQTDAEVRNAFGTEAFDRLAKQPDIPVPRPQKADDRGDAGSLSRPVTPQQRQDAARRQGKADAVQDMAIAIKRMHIHQ